MEKGLIVLIPDRFLKKNNLLLFVELHFFRTPRDTLPIYSIIKKRRIIFVSGSTFQNTFAYFYISTAPEIHIVFQQVGTFRFKRFKMALSSLSSLNR